MTEIIIILIVLLVASGWLAYAFTIKLVQDRDQEKERYKKALELLNARSQDSMLQAQDEIEAWQARVEEEYARGRQEGKRATLAWIKQQVEDGTLEVRVIGTPVKRPPAQ